jgi:hypothetical protein
MHYGNSQKKCRAISGMTLLLPLDIMGFGRFTLFHRHILGRLIWPLPVFVVYSIQRARNLPIFILELDRRRTVHPPERLVSMTTFDDVAFIR